jgi:ABC-type uncharacterized transport system auxiliary subunit
VIRRNLALLLWILATTSCFGARASQRSFFVLYGTPDEVVRRPEPLFRGLVRVRNLDSEDVYDKFQIVVRKSPYELTYSESNVWAVKPYQMLSDIIARRLVETNTFASATRELGEARPELTLGGELHAIEVYDSEDLWYAHLSLTLTLTQFATGDRLWGFTFDERKQVMTLSFSHAVRTLSELLDEAMLRAVTELERVARGERIVPSLQIMVPSNTATKTDESVLPDPVPQDPAPPEDPAIYVPEKPQ